MSGSTPAPALPFEEFAARLERVIWTIAQREFGRSACSQREVQQGVLELSTAYNNGRPPSSPGPALQLASLVFFGVADLPKAAIALAELAPGRWPHPGDPDHPPARLRVLDVGAGCGAMTLGLVGLAEALQLPARLEVTALDSNTRSLELMARVLDQARGAGVFSRTVELRTRRRNLIFGLPAEGGEFDLVLAGNLLNEMPYEGRLPLVQGLLRQLSAEGRLLIVEPALRQTSRDLHRLRDTLMTGRQAQVLCPCTRGGPCPALDCPRDWCMERRPWRQPPQLQRLSQATRLRRQNVSWSQLVLAPPGAATVHTGAWRVVSKPLRSKGKLEIYLCGEPGRLLATRLNRHRNQRNHTVERLRRGQLARLKGPYEIRGQRLLIGPEVVVTQEDPAGVEQWAHG